MQYHKKESMIVIQIGNQNYGHYWSPNKLNDLKHGHTVPQMQSTQFRSEILQRLEFIMFAVSSRRCLMMTTRGQRV